MRDVTVSWLVRLVDSKIKTESQRSLSTCISLHAIDDLRRTRQCTFDRLGPQLHVKLRPRTCEKLADASADGTVRPLPHISGL